MTHPRLRPRWIAILSLLVAIPACLPALSYISVQAGDMVLFNPGDEGALSPLLATLGAAVPVVETGPFRLEVSALFWGTQYYVAPSGRILPAQYEAGQFSVLGIWLAPLAGLHLDLAKDKLELGLAGTAALNVRFPLFPYDAPATGDTEAQDEWKATWSTALGYFMGKARFLFPEVDAWVRFRVAESLSVALTVKTLFPLFHAWDGDKQTVADQLIVGAILGFDIRIPPRGGTPSGGAP